MKKSAAELAGVTSEVVLSRDWTCVPPGSVFVRVSCRLQDSVTCGPVSLMMAADALLPGHGKSCAGLIEQAVVGGLSRQGELFSCDAMALLARTYWGGQLGARVLSDWSKEDVKMAAQEGSVLLVPYDCSSNFEPDLFGGERAHWCVVAGVADEHTVICCQPKSKRVGQWRVSDLAASNANLVACVNKQQQGLLVPDSLDSLRAMAVLVWKEK